MFAIEVEYLSGRTIATRFNDRSRAEWPPDPTRLFSALVATYEAGDREAVEREALGWLSQQPPPRMVAAEASEREVRTHFVPVNDITVVNHSPINSGLVKVRCLEAALADAVTEKERNQLSKKLEKELVNLEAMGRKKASEADGSKAPTLELLPDHRKKQARTFPSVTPEDPIVYWVWEEAPVAFVGALDRLARNLVRLGHSSSLVRARALEQLPEGVEPNWVPDPEGEEFLRVPLGDQLDRLEALFEQHHAVEPRVLPFRWQTYTRGKKNGEKEKSAVVGHTVFSADDWIVFQRADGPAERKDNIRYLPLGRGADLALRVRDALIKYTDQANNGRVPETISGHMASGGHSASPHLAVVPLAHVGAKHSDGKLRGVALVLPRGMSTDDRLVLLRGIGQWEAAAKQLPQLEAHNEDLDVPDVPVFMGRAGVLHLSRLTQTPNLRTLNPTRWSRKARQWRSVTPVALDRNPGDLRSRAPGVAKAAFERAEGSVRAACERVGLPAPIHIDVSFAPGVVGTEPATRFPGFPQVQQAGKPRRVLAHVALRFAEEVEGPILLGAGRYFGLGLFLPMEGER